MLAEAGGPSIAPKGAGDSFQGLRAIKTFVGQDGACLAAPDYIERKPEAEASGKAKPLCQLRWHLLSEHGPLATQTKNHLPSARARQERQESTWRSPSSDVALSGSPCRRLYSSSPGK